MKSSFFDKIVFCVYYNSNMELLFNGSNGQKLTPPQVVNEIRNFMNGDQNRCYKVIIGSDSEHLQNKTADFVTAIVVHRVGNGGKYFYRRLHEANRLVMRDRIWKEVLMSLEVAQIIISQFKDFNNFEFEIHVDVGQNGPTKALIQEVTGVIRGSGFNVKTKPESYGASNVADRHL